MRARFAIVCGLVAACAVGALFFPAAASVAHSEREGQFVELQQEAADAAAGSTLGELATPGRPSADDPRGAAKLRGEDDHDYALYDAGGTRTAGDGPATLEPVLTPALQGRTRSSRIGDAIVVAVPLAASGKALRAAEPAREADDRVREAVGRLAAGALLLILLAPLVAWFVAGRLVRPLRAVADAATRIGDGDVATMAPLPGIREIDDVAEALNAAAGRISELLNRERRLTADTSHQLRTPLAGLRLTLEGELASPGGDPSHIIEEALGAVHRLERTVDDLTTLARGESPSGRVDLRMVLERAAGRWAAQFVRAGRRLIVAAEPGLSSDGREAGLDAILDVLIDNALHHGQGTVRLRALRGDATISVSVADEGHCDLADEDLFTRSVSGAGGTGIGLDLARTLAGADRATLRLTSARPTAFTLELAS